MHFFLLIFLAFGCATVPKKFVRPAPSGEWIYLASRDEMVQVNRILKSTPIQKNQTLVGIIGGLAVLNFVEKLIPANIELVDISPRQVEFGKCFIELIKVTPHRSELITSFFSRKFESENDFIFLSKSPREEILNQTLARLPDEMRNSCQSFLRPIYASKYNPEVKALEIQNNPYGRYLTLRGNIELKTFFNHLYYGEGWLKSDASYKSTRKTLLKANISFTVSDIGDYELKDVKKDTIYFWGTNLATYFEPVPTAYKKFVTKTHTRLADLNAKKRFVYLSTYQAPKWTDFRPFKLLGKGPHLDSAAKVRQYTKGRSVLELTPGPYLFGDELGGTYVARNAATPFVKDESYDVVLLHILASPGFSWWIENKEAKIKAVFDEAFQYGKKVLVLEHNPESSDFELVKAKLLPLSTIIDWAISLKCETQLSMEVEFISGKTDNKRNVLVSVECAD